MRRLPDIYLARITPQRYDRILESMGSLSANISELTRAVERLAAQNAAIQIQARRMLWAIGMGLAAVAILVVLQ